MILSWKQWFILTLKQPHVINPLQKVETLFYGFILDLNVDLYLNIVSNIWYVLECLNTFLINWI